MTKAEDKCVRVSSLRDRRLTVHNTQVHWIPRGQNQYRLLLYDDASTQLVLWAELPEENKTLQTQISVVSEEAIDESQTEQVTAASNAGTTVYYFHNTRRCETCMAIEKETSVQAIIESLIHEYIKKNKEKSE